MDPILNTMTMTEDLCRIVKKPRFILNINLYKLVNYIQRYLTFVYFKSQTYEVPKTF